MMTISIFIPLQYHIQKDTHSPSPYRHLDNTLICMNKRSDSLSKFGQRIIQLRKQKGFTSQITFANKAKMDRTYIGGIERGERNPTFEIMEKLAKTLGVKIEDLFKF